MAQNRGKLQYKNGTGYIDGNTVRKRDYGGYTVHNIDTAYSRVSPVPEPEIRERTRPERHVRQEPKDLSGISPASLFVLILAIGVTLYFCIDFLMLQNEVNTMEKNIVSMEETLASMKKENDATYEQIKSTYDLDYVYKVAVSELGMVYPNNNEVITYNKADESYTRQYADIPDK